MPDYKKARKGSQDPKQEQLRNYKSQWNKEVSLLIAQLIAFKKGLNGRGEPRIGIPPSDIKYPLPEEVPRYLDQMASRFEMVVSDASQIIKEQEEYSRTRRRGKGDITASFDREIMKEASWFGSRLWTYLKNFVPKHWDEHLKSRMRLLWISTRVSKGLLDLENSLLSSNENAIPRSFYHFIKMRNRIFEMSNTLKDMVEKMSDVAETAEKIPEPDTDLPEPLMGREEPIKEEIVNKDESSWDPNIDWARVDVIQEDLTAANSVIGILASINLVNKQEYETLQNMVKKLDELGRKHIGLNRINETYLENPKMAEMMKKYVSDFFHHYSQLFDYASGLVESHTGEKYNNFAMIISSPQLKELLKKNSSTKEIEKIAHNWLTRILKRLKLKIMPSHTDRIRLKAVNEIRDLHEFVGDFQDLLENEGSDIFMLSNNMQDILHKFSNLSEVIINVAESHNADYDEQRLDNSKIKIRPISRSNLSLMKQSKGKFDIMAADLLSLTESLEGVMMSKVEHG